MKAALLSLGSVSSQLIASELGNYFDQVEVFNLNKLHYSINTKGESVLKYGNKDLEENFDLVYIRGPHYLQQFLYGLSQHFEGKSYLPLSKESFLIAHNKILSHIFFAKHKIPMPTTYIVQNINVAKEILKEVNYPIVIKIPEGTQGKGVIVVDDYGAASSILDTLALFSLKKPFIIQEFIDSEGEDIRIITSKEGIIASMKRKASRREYRSNIHAGGQGIPYEPSEEEEKIAKRVAKVLNCDIIAVDLIPTALGPLLIEPNISPGIQGISQATGKNIAKFIAEHLFEKTREFRGAKAKETYKDLFWPEKEQHNLIDTIKFKGRNLLLPKSVAELAEFKEDEEIIIKIEKKSFKVEKFQ